MTRNHRRQKGILINVLKNLDLIDFLRLEPAHRGDKRSGTKIFLCKCNEEVKSSMLSRHYFHTQIHLEDLPAISEKLEEWGYSIGDYSSVNLLEEIIPPQIG